MKILHRVAAALGRLPVRAQLFVTFASLLVLTMLVTGVALFGMSRVDAQSRQLADKWLVGVGRLSEARSGMVEAREFEVKHSRTDDKSYHSEYEEKIEDAAKLVEAQLAAYRSMVGNADEKVLFDRLATGWASYRQAQARVIALGRDKKQQDAADISDGLGATAFDETLGAHSALSKLNFIGGETAAARSTAVYVQARAQALTLLVLSLLFGGALMLLISSSLVRRLGGEPQAAVALARAVSQGDLTTVAALRRGDTDSLMASLYAMQRDLGAMVDDVRRGSGLVAATSAEIAQGNNDLSQRTEEQASALEETAASMEELSSTVKQNADNARQANQLALERLDRSRSRAARSSAQVVDTMKGINDSRPRRSPTSSA